MEDLEVLNKRLLQYYGKVHNQPRFRVVWSSDQYERKMIFETPEGLQLLSPVIRTVPKYTYARDRYILELITPVPEQFIDDVGGKLSYEPIWVFEDKDGNPLPPKWEAIAVIFDAITHYDRKTPYKQDEKDHNTTEALEEKAKILEQQLYGNESRVGDALSTGSGVGYGRKSEPQAKILNNPLRGKL